MTEEATNGTTLRDQVLDVLKTCYDPEIPVDIYELGLVYKVDVDDAGKVTVDMTLTSPACPVAGSLPPEVEQKISPRRRCLERARGPGLGSPLEPRPHVRSRQTQTRLPLGPRTPRLANRAEARGRLGTPTSGRHSGPQAAAAKTPIVGMAPVSARTPKGRVAQRPRNAAHRRLKRTAGTAWNADLRSAQRPAGPRRRSPQSLEWFPSRHVPPEGRGGAAAPERPASPTEQKRGDGLERRPPVGTAAPRAAAAKTPTVGMAPVSARTP